MSDRSDFYFKQLVTEAEMDQAFDDLETADRNLIADQTDGVHAVWGVFEGYEVTENSGTPDLFVEVANGVAYDEQGRRIPHTAGPTLVDLTTGVPGSDSRYVRVYAEYAETTSDPRVDGSGSPLDYRLTESVAFSIQLGTIAASPVRPAILTDKVLITTVLIATGTTQIFDADISQALQEDPLNPTVIDRQEGGFVFPHGRMAARVARFLPGSAAIRLDMGGHHIRTSGGDLQFDDIDTPFESGGRIFMQRGSIYRAGEVRAEGPPSASAGFLYVEAGGGYDEFGTLMEVPKPTQYDALQMWPMSVSSPVQSPWDITPVVDSWYLSSPGPLPRTAYRARWLMNVAATGGVFNWHGLCCPLVDLPAGCRLDSFEFGINVISVVALLEFGVGIYRKVPGTATLINTGAVVTFGAMPGTGPQWFNLDVIDPALDIVFPATYAYYAVLFVNATAAFAGGSIGIEVEQARLQNSIREASGTF